ncbi:MULTISPECIES: lambda exonuclease family protein [unclassified Pseudomonas]|uniref:lambda exonuclease family protein n=1 Tax=unclassified Pseudomonas TaxID=196821 RepID=UPI001AE7EB06|nr:MULTISPECIES: lambda exonuclease family protein [unclassified Pseudomonas]HDS1695780.1 YqaJ viral recombinase family protein [Pseudomonas putida]MBP2270793.1 putative phage-type endonuclease [Pseudomonas sp. BP6]MBP2284924.1 putative phage-type endonuclease [Pseudomonas sp. BP7]MBP2290261.1 putative phage-type endonuclease [Pseudomonas sp. BP7]HDS1701002.1 YqaJ viral recombinase family protein [Pseudomonas putida]
MEQRSAEWFAARLGCVTASRVKDVMASGRGGAPSATRKNYMMELLCERLTGQQSGPDLSNKPAVQRGVELEPFACMAYEADKGLMVVETGLVMHPSIPGFGASPDGLVGDDGVLEIKCPNTATHIATMQSERHDPQYEWQMLAQMACTGRAWADFVSYDDRLPEPLQYVCHRFERDFKRIREMEAEIKAFLEELSDLEKEMRERMKEAA